MRLPTLAALAALITFPLLGCAADDATMPAPVADGGHDVEAAAADATPDVTPAVPGDPMNVVVHKLANGLTVMLSENHETPRIDCWITTRTGSANDPADATGMAHYLEHMLFKGTAELGTLDWEKEKPHLDRITELYKELFRTTDTDARRKLYDEIDKENQAACQYVVANEFDQLYDAIGGQGINAFTSNDQTSYIVNIPSNRLGTWAQIESHRFVDPVFRLFQSEIEAVYEEKNRAMDNKGRVINEALMLAVFPEHPYGLQSTLGTVEHLKNPPIHKMYEYFYKWYVPGNMCIALAGDFDSAEALATIEEHFGKWEAKPVPPDPVAPINPPKGVVRATTQFEAEEQLMVAFLTVPDGHEDQDALILCDMMLDNQNTGLVNVNLSQKQAVLAAGAGPRFMLDGGMQLLYAIPKPGQTLEEAEQLLLQQVELLKQGAFTDDDLAAVLTDFEIREKQSLEGNNQRVRAMTDSFIRQTPWSWDVHQLDRLRRITREQIIATANKYFGPNYVAVTRTTGTQEIPEMVKPGFTAVEIQRGRRTPFGQAILDQEVPPIEPYFLTEGKDYRVEEIPSGKLYWAPNPSNDLFQLSFRFPLGTNHDPKLQMAAQLMNFAGAGSLDLQAYKRRLYALGSTINVGAGAEQTVVTLTGLDANLESTLALMKDHFVQPTGIVQPVLDQFVARAIGGRMNQMGEARAIDAALGEYATRGGESTFLAGLTNAQLRELKADELMRTLADVWGIERRVEYVGTRTVEELAPLLPSRLVGTEPLLPAPPRKPITYANAGKNRVLLVDRQTAQSTVSILSPDGRYDAKDYPVQRAYNEYMSGSMGAVVFQEVRESRSLAYAVSTRYRTPTHKEDQNLMWGMLGTQVDKTTEAIDVLLGIVRRMPTTEKWFAQTKRSLDETYRTSRVPFRRIPGAAIQWEDQGLDGDPRDYNWKTILDLELEDVQQFASRFESMPFTVTIVGDKAGIDMDKLGEFGEIIELEPTELFNWDDAPEGSE